MVAQIQPVTTPDIFYPDCDGQPVANNTEQFEIIVLIKGNLDILYANDPNVFVAGDLFWYPVEGNNTIKYAPDVMVALGRPKGRRYSYKQWEEGNQPPQIVFEILSPGNTREEMDRKLLFYDRHGVEEYYIYDPPTNQLRVWLRSAYGLDWVQFDQEWISPRLQIRFNLSGEQWQLYYPDGQPFMTFAELMELARNAQQQAHEAQQQAHEAQQRLQQAIPRLLSLGLNSEQIAETLGLTVEEIQNLLH